MAYLENELNDEQLNTVTRTIELITNYKSPL